MTEVVIRCVAVAGPSMWYPPVPPGWYLAAYNPEGRAGAGSITWTGDLADAWVFADAVAAFKCYRQVSRIRPRRGDGRPNRPLTAYTILTTPREEAEGPLAPGLDLEFLLKGESDDG